MKSLSAAPLLALLLATPAFAQTWGLLPAPAGTTNLKSVWSRSLSQLYVGSAVDARVFFYNGSAWTTQIPVLGPGAGVASLYGDASATYACGGFSTASSAPVASTTWSTFSLGSLLANANCINRSGSLFYVAADQGKYAFGSVPPLTPVTTSLTSTRFWGVTGVSSTFIAVGDSGTIITGSGASWLARASGTTNTLFSVAQANTTAIAVGANGQIIVSNTSGNSWTPVNHGLTTATLRSVAYVTGNAIAVGDGGVILRSTTNGTTWTLESSGTTGNLQGVWIADATHAFIVGDSGTVLTTPVPAPIPFSITSPTNAGFVESTTPTITWTASLNVAGGYTLTLDDNADFSSPVLLQTGIAGTSFAVPPNTLSPNSIYYLRVQAANTSGTTTATPQPLRFAVIAPITGCDPDFNHDGNIDQDDITALINVVAGGGCP